MTKKLYKFLNRNRSEHGEHEWKIGKWYEVEGYLKMCENGFHASKYAQEALKYVNGDTLSIVEVDGEHLREEDKQCWRKMRVVQTYDWTPIHSLKLAIYAVKLANDGYDEYGCVENAESILKKLESGEEIPDSLLSAAAAAVESVWSIRAAARAAAQAAEASQAAESAVRAAARATAWAAAGSEAWSAEAAAEAAARAAAWSAQAAAWTVSWAAAQVAWTVAEASAQAAWSAHQTEIRQKIHDYCLSIVEVE